MSRWHTNKPWSSLPKDHSFNAYCAYNTHINSVHMCIQFSLYTYAYMFVRTHAILPGRVFGPCSSVRMPLSLDRGLPLSPNSVLHVRPQISTERPPPFIMGLICIDRFFSRINFHVWEIQEGVINWYKYWKLLAKSCTEQPISSL